MLWTAFGRPKLRAGSRHMLGVVKAAVALGNEPDTTARIAGGLAGVHFGFDAIPLSWMDVLRGRDMVKPLEKGLLLRG